MRKLWRGKWIIAVATLLCLTLAFFYTSSLVPVYRASAKVMFNLQEKNITNIEDVVVNPTPGGEALQNEIEVLTSTALIERVIEKLGLAESPAFNPRLRVPEPGLFEQWFDWLAVPPELDAFLRNVGLVRPDPPAPDPDVVARRERLSVIGKVRAGLSLSPVPNSTVIVISYTSRNPNISARIANAIADQYIVEQLEGKLDATRSATEWLSTRVQELQTKVQAAENRVADARTRLAAEAGQTVEVTQQQLQAISASLAVARSEQVGLAAQVARLEEALENEADIGSVPEFRDAPLIQSFRAEEDDLQSRAVSLRNSVGPDHPSLERVNAQLEELRRKMRVEADRIVQSYRVELDAARDRTRELAENVRDLEQKALEQSSDEIELRQLEREAQASRQLYENFLSRLQETSQQESLQSANARVITPAEVPTGPLTSSRNRILAIGGIMGIVLGSGVVLLLGALNNTFLGPQQVETEAGLNVLASIPVVGRRMHRKDVIKHFRERPNSSLAEAVRNLRTSILFSNIDDPPKAIMFTSSLPTEGKSTTATLVALAGQQMGRSAILVDCDLRLPSLSRILEFDKDKPGLLSVMNETATFEDALSIEPTSGLHVLAARPDETKTKMNSADVLASQRFKSLIERLKKNYDLVVLDTPPALIVTDARILAKVADAVIYVIRWDKTPRGAVIEGLKELNSVGAPIIGGALAMVNETKAAKYAYDGYGYGYDKRLYKQYYVE